MDSWLSLESNVPKIGSVYWCYPTLGKSKISPLKWDGIHFTCGKYIPHNITHYCEIILFRPKPPKIKNVKR